MKLNRRLTEMVKDVELPKTVTDLERAAYDRTAVVMVLDTLEIRNPSLRERLFAVDPGTEEAEAAAPVVEGVELDGTVLGAGELKPWLAEHDGKAVLGLATVDTWALGSGSVAEVALAAADGAAAWFDPSRLDEADENAFAKWLADPEKPKVLHNAKGAMRVFAEHGWTIEGVSMDTALAAYLVKPGRRSFALDALSLEYLGRELGPAAAADGQLAFGADDQAEAEALMVQARTILDLGEAFGEKLAEVGAAELLRDMELPTSALLARLERHGIAADRAHLEAMEQMFMRRRAAGGEGGPRLRRARVQPRLAQAAPGGLLRRAGPAQDEEDEDRLHDGRGRAGLAGHADRPRAAGRHAAPP